MKIGKTAIQACNFIWEAVTWILYPAGVWLFNCACEPFYVWNWFFDEGLAEQSQKAVEGFGEHHDYSSLVFGTYKFLSERIFSLNVSTPI